MGFGGSSQGKEGFQLQVGLQIEEMT